MAKSMLYVSKGYSQDDALIADFEADGWGGLDAQSNPTASVTVVADTAAAPANVADFDCVFVSETSSGSSAPGDTYDTAGTAVVTSEPFVVDEQRMAGGASSGGTGTQLDTVGTHEILDRAGLSGTVTIVSAAREILSFSSLAAGSTAVLEHPTSGDPVVIAAESGSTATTGTFPARRAAIGLRFEAYPVLTPEGVALMLALVNWAANIDPPPTANAGADQTVANGTTGITLDGSGSAPGTGGNTLTYSWTQIGGATVSLSSTTAQSPTFDGLSPGTQQTYTFQLEITESETGQTATDTVQVTESAPTNQPPTVAPAVDQATVEDGTVVSLHANAADPDGTIAAVAWTEPEPGLLSALNIADPTFDTTGHAGEAFTFDVQATDNDGATSTVESVTVTVVAANEPIGQPVTGTVTTTVPEGAATAQLIVRARNLNDGEYITIDSFGILTGDLTAWVPGGIVDTGRVYLEYRDPIEWADDGTPVYDADGWEPVRFGQGVTPDATGQAVVLDHEIPHGAARQYRARVRAEL